MGRLDPTVYDPAMHTYALMPSAGTQVGKGVHMVQAFWLDPTSTETTVSIGNDSTALMYDVDLLSMLPVSIPAGQNNITVDWSEMETNALGREFKPRSIYEVMITHYTQTPEELEGQFLDLEIIADNMYRGDVLAGNDLAFTDIVDEAGNPFPGITNSGTWVLSLICGTCGNPAPWYLTRLEACQ